MRILGDKSIHRLGQRRNYRRCQSAIDRSVDANQRLLIKLLRSIADAPAIVAADRSTAIVTAAGVIGVIGVVIAPIDSEL